MERIYYSTFISGIQEFIPEILNKYLKNVEVVRLLDGSVLYKTTSNFNMLRGLRFFNNTFLVLKTFENKSLEQMGDLILKNKNMEKDVRECFALSELGKTFRMIFSSENNLVSADKRLVEKLESKIMWCGLRLDRSEPDIEFWFLQRREGLGLFMIRLTKHRAYEKVLQKGELRPEIADLLCLISNPEREVILDPFCGHGAIIMERSKFPFKKIIGIDSDRKKVFELNRKIREKKNIEVFSSDSLDMSRISHGSIDKIITDPPWGIFEKIKVDSFYERMFSQFSRALRMEGILILLTSQKELIEKILSKSKEFKLEKKYDILVSGRKAAIYKMIRL